MVQKERLLIMLLKNISFNGLAGVMAQSLKRRKLIKKIQQQYTTLMKKFNGTKWKLFKFKWK